MKSVVSFLVINQIPELPKVAIQSVLECSDSDICIGYLNDEDIEGLDFSERVKFQRLAALPNQNLSGRYRDFSETLFYEIVQLKWQLLERMIKSDYELIIYSDLDVIWLRNPIPSIQRTFQSNHQISVLIQSFTSDPSEPRLCMGFIAFTNSESARHVVSDCKKLHLEMSQTNPQLGDDDVVTQYFVESENRLCMQLLPQTTFPVGSLLNLYTTRPLFPGLNAPEPYIFHLNYVVGLQNKRIMLRLLKKHYAPRIHTYGLFSWRMLILLKRLRLISWKLKKKVTSLKIT